MAFVFNPNKNQSGMSIMDRPARLGYNIGQERGQWAAWLIVNGAAIGFTRAADTREEAECRAFNWMLRTAASEEWA